MAITKIKAIKKRLDHVITYITNPSKTSEENYLDLHNVIDYAKASYKTEEQLYCTSINCSNENPYQDMIRTKRRYSKKDGILGFHIIQSFAEGEVTPKTAHEIGIKFAEEMWGDRFEIVVTTHINTNHIHNHICINSVSFKDGKRYYDNHKSYALLRDTSDNLCREYNLTVIEEKKCKGSNLQYRNFMKNELQNEYYSNIKEDIDFAIEQAYSYIDFVDILKKMDYVIETRAGKLSVRRTNRKRNTRIERVFGEEYSLQRINERIFETESVRVPFPEARTLKGKYKFNSKNKNKIRNKRKVTGIRALYFHYCYLLKVYPKKKRRISKELREEIKKMDKISNEVRFLCRNNIQTDQELFSFKESFNNERKKLISTRCKLYKKKSKTNSKEEQIKINEELNQIKQQLKELNYKKELIEDIETRIPRIKEIIENTEDREINQIKKEKEKEKEL